MLRLPACCSCPSWLACCGCSCCCLASLAFTFVSYSVAKSLLNAAARCLAMVDPFCCCFSSAVVALLASFSFIAESFKHVKKW
ncbi:hypothetical protein COO60DRAFT_1533351 [Scenedesmus sp. NREL 46B-D3]|nr:hypothetical protein COO60DRAFT_1533351 [Scenedesmus sp. NREL 46B-D3]